MLFRLRRLITTAATSMAAVAASSSTAAVSQPFAAAPGDPPTISASARSACETASRFGIAGADIQFAFQPSDFTLTQAEVCRWITDAALAVSGYFGRFPVTAVRIVIKPNDGGHVMGGTTYGQDYGDSRAGNAALIVIQLGRGSTAATLGNDWVMTHEMVHLAVPAVPDRNHWLEEGIATYVEPVARAQAGQLSQQRIWSDMLDGMPQGLPKSGDRGLDNTPTWGRTYWGGALFCLLADVDIRRRTSNRKGLREALRGVLAAGGNIRQDWSVMRIFAAADAAIGQPVLSELYAKMGTDPGPDELESLWRSLGVEADGRSVRFDAAAPLAAVRAAIAAPDRAGLDPEIPVVARPGS